MKIWGVIILIVALLNTSLIYFAAVDKIKPRKSTQILYYSIVSMDLFVAALKEFLR